VAKKLFSSKNLQKSKKSLLNFHCERSQKRVGSTQRDLVRPFESKSVVKFWLSRFLVMFGIEINVKFEIKKFRKLTFLENPVYERIKAKIKKSNRLILCRISRRSFWYQNQVVLTKTGEKIGFSASKTQ
jgi:hypothetical protein